MNASSPQQLAAEPLDDYDDGFGAVLPERPRASYLTPLTALLMALILGGVGFYVGIRVEKSQTSSAGGAASSLVSRFTGAAAATGAAGKAGSGTRSGFPGGLASRFAAAGGFGGAGGATSGAITSVDGNTIYVKESGGNTVKVKLSSATKISKSESVARKRLYPGDEVTVAGSSGSGGTVHATSVTDSGASATSSATSAGSSSTSSSSAAISSLFGGG